MVKVNNIDPQTVELFDPEGNSMGIINQYEFNDIRIQIKNQKASGYYCLFNNEKIFFQDKGGMSNWPEGFFDLQTNQLNELLGI